MTPAWFSIVVGATLVVAPPEATDAADIASKGGGVKPRPYAGRPASTP